MSDSIVVTSTQAVKASAQAPAENTETADKNKPSDKTQGEDQAPQENLDAKAKDSEAQEGEESNQEDRPKKKSGIQRLKERHAREMSDVMRKIEALEQGLQNKAQQDAPKPQSIKKDERPKQDDFESHEEWQEAVIDWKVNQRLLADQAKQKDEQLKTDYQTQVKGHADRVQAFRNSHTDWDDVMEEVGDVRLSVAVEDLIISSENGPDLMYALAQDREELERICALPAQAAAREIGRLEARLTADTKSDNVEIKKPKAPPPINPVGGSGNGAVKKSVFDSDLSQSEYEALRREQMNKRRSAWG